LITSTADAGSEVGILYDAVVIVDLAAAGFMGLVNVPGTDGSARSSLSVDSNGSISIDPASPADSLCRGASLVGFSAGGCHRPWRQ